MTTTNSQDLQNLRLPKLYLRYFIIKHYSQVVMIEL